MWKQTFLHTLGQQELREAAQCCQGELPGTPLRHSEQELLSGTEPLEKSLHTYHIIGEALEVIKRGFQCVGVYVQDHHIFQGHASYFLYVSKFRRRKRKM